MLFKGEHRDFRELAAEAFQGYLYVLITALVFLLPVESPALLALMYAAINVVMLIRTSCLRSPTCWACSRSSRR